MKKQLSLFLLILTACGLFAQKPNVWIHTDLTGITGFTQNGSKIEADTDQDSDPDDQVAMAMYLMLANQFNTKGIVVGSTTRNTTNNTLTKFNEYHGAAYTNDLTCLNAQIGGYPTLANLNVMESSLTSGSGFRSFSASPENKYDNYNDLLPSVKALVDELGKSEYSAQNPLNVLIWGPMTEIGMALKYLVRNNKTTELERLHIISHWTTSYSNQQGNNNCYSGNEAVYYGVANCNQNCESCFYVREQSSKSGAKFKFTDLASVGQTGVVNGSASFFTGGNGGVGGPQYNQFRNSQLGDLFVRGKFGFGKPDGSDCATFLVLLEKYGVKLSDYNNNGLTTAQQESNALNKFKNSAPGLMQDLLVISDIAASGNCTTNPPVDPVISFVSPTVNQTVSGTIDVIVNAHDADFGTNHGDGITSVYFQLLSVNDPNTTLVSGLMSSMPFSWTLNTTDYPNGDYELRAGVQSQDFTSGRKWTILKPITINNSVTPPSNDFVTTFDYPTDAGQMFTSTKYDVYVKVGNDAEQKLEVLMSDVNYRTMYEGDWMKNELKDRTFSFVHLDYDVAGAGLTFRVVKKFGNNSTEAVIAPKSYGYTATVTKANEMTFSMDENSKYISVNFKGTDNETSVQKWIKHMLCIFVDPPETDIPDPQANGVVTYTKNTSSSALANASIIYFPKGHHILKDYVNTNPIDARGILTLKSDQSVYIQGGAFVEGIIQRTNYGDKNQKVFGRGILSGRDYYWSSHPNYNETKEISQLIELGQQAEVSGIMYMESPNHGITGRDVHIQNVKFLGWHANHDGIRVGSGSEIHNCFLRAVDDHFYNFNIHVHDCVIWAGHNGAILTYGWGGDVNSNNYQAGSSLLEDIDIINPEWRGLGNNNGLIMAQVGYNHPITDYGSGDATTIMRNIRVEGSIPGISNLKPRSSGSGNIAVQVGTNEVSFLGDLILENITVEAIFEKGLIRGEADPDYDGNKKWLVKDVLFKNVSIGGNCITENNKDQYFNIDYNTIENVKFECADVVEPTPEDLTDLNVFAIDCKNIELTWTDTQGEDSYRVRRKVLGEATYQILTDVPANTERYVDQTAQENVTYVYMVRPMVAGVAVKISNTPQITIPNCTVTSISEFETSSYYPNPTTGLLYFHANQQFALYDLYGKTIENGFSDQVDLSSLTNGVYVLELDGKRFFIQKQ